MKTDDIPFPQDGVSILVSDLNFTDQLSPFFSGILQDIPLCPLEFIVVGQELTDGMQHVMRNFSDRCFIRFMFHNCKSSVFDSLNYAASRSKYPYLLFVNCGLNFRFDFLASAIDLLTQCPDIGVVGARIDDIDSASHNGDPQIQQFFGIEFKWTGLKKCFQPEQISHLSNDQVSGNTSSGKHLLYPAVTADFLLLRKNDFDSLSGFNKEKGGDWADIDVCLRMGRDLGKKCCLINEIGVQLHPGASLYHYSCPDRTACDTIPHEYVLETLDSEEYISLARWFYYLGYSCELGGMLEKSAEAYKEATRLDDSHPSWFYSLGNVLFHLGMHQDSCTAYLAALNIDTVQFCPDNKKANDRRG
ncbi:hypothetical protein [Desulfolutivibrio sulfoxidireducens]|uniref:hypothetical protein n=1 Tax=Desulfolutivibrio sulfoxidireducens TaxID=2773299 RepID=UPI00159E682C|nr:hypothetical protein [Desulfolutivibrio sulfoxidireducens]QLA18860.1 hypothetical protein GD604_03505 [Desulfolutivibrio sulfoxidireducens]